MRKLIHRARRRSVAALLMLPLGVAQLTAQTVTPEVILEGVFEGAEGLAFNGEGRLFIAADHAVWEVSLDGSTRLLRRFDSNLGLSPIGERDLLFADFGPTAAPQVGPNSDGIVWRLTPEGEASAIARSIGDPNAFAVLPDGRILVSDDFTHNIYEVAMDGAFGIFTDDIPFPNGLALAPDGRTLYVAQLFSRAPAEPPPARYTEFSDQVWRLPLENYRPTGPAEVIFKTGSASGPDGLAVDSRGRLYLSAARAGELWRIDPTTGQGELLAEGFPGLASLAFGRGAFDHHSLYAAQIRGGRLLRFPIGASGAAAPTTEATSTSALAELAETLVRAYHAGDAEALRPHLAEQLSFRDPKLGQSFGLEEFLDSAVKSAEVDDDRALEISWIGATESHADARGTWSWTNRESGARREMVFSIELEFATIKGEPKVVSWLDDFRRRRMWKPAKGDGEHVTDNFRVVYFRSEFSDDEASRLGQTLERWYDETSQFLGRSFEDDFRLHINIAGSHDIYASDPGPDAFMLVSTRSAEHDYGFTLVHELTHNLMGLSWLTKQEREYDGVELYSGNRLFDEGFAVYVEEKLTGEGPEIWPNFGEETHAGYWKAREEKGAPIWPALEAEIHRERGDVRLAYLAQGSFVKYLVEAHGLEPFLRLFSSDTAAAREIYGKDLQQLDGEWRAFLERRFAESSGS